METSKPNVLTLYSLVSILGCVFTSVLALSAVIIYKYKGLTINRDRKRKGSSNNDFHRRNAKKSYSLQETAVEMPCSRDELEEFMVRVESSRNREKRVIYAPGVFSFPWPGRPYVVKEEEKGDQGGYDKPRSPPLGVMNAPGVFSSPWPGRPVEKKKKDEEGSEYDKPRSPPLSVRNPTEKEPKRTEPGGMIEDKKKNEEIYLDLSSSSSGSSKTAVIYANCRRGTVLLPTTSPPSFKQQQVQQGGQKKYESLEHIYESIDIGSVSKEDSSAFVSSGGPDGVFPHLADG